MKFCDACGIVVPVVKRVVGTAVGAALGGALGSRSRTWWGILLTAGLGALAGRLVDEAAGDICGHCGGPVRELA